MEKESFNHFGGVNAVRCLDMLEQRVPLRGVGCTPPKNEKLMVIKFWYSDFILFPLPLLMFSPFSLIFHQARKIKRILGAYICSLWASISRWLIYWIPMPSSRVWIRGPDFRFSLSSSYLQLTGRRWTVFSVTRELYPEAGTY